LTVATDKPAFCSTAKGADELLALSLAGRAAAVVTAVATAAGVVVVLVVPGVVVSVFVVAGSVSLPPPKQPVSPATSNAANPHLVFEKYLENLMSILLLPNDDGLPTCFRRCGSATYCWPGYDGKIGI
jgi:hypothetical protein